MKPEILVLGSVWSPEVRAQVEQAFQCHFVPAIPVAGEPAFDAIAGGIRAVLTTGTLGVTHIGLQHADHSVRRARGGAGQAQSGLALAQQGCEGLRQFVGDAGRHLTHCVHAHGVGKPYFVLTQTDTQPRLPHRPPVARDESGNPDGRRAAQRHREQQAGRKHLGQRWDTGDPKQERLRAAAKRFLEHERWQE